MGRTLGVGVGVGVGGTKNWGLAVMSPSAVTVMEAAALVWPAALQETKGLVEGLVGAAVRVACWPQLSGIVVVPRTRRRVVLPNRASTVPRSLDPEAGIWTVTEQPTPWDGEFNGPLPHPTNTRPPAARSDMGAAAKRMGAPRVTPWNPLAPSPSEYRIGPWPRPPRGCALCAAAVGYGRMAAVQPVVSRGTGHSASEERDRPWQVVVWNDPVTLMSYVVVVFRRLFGYDLETATQLMLKVHVEGRAVVASEPRERAEVSVAQLHAHGLQATLARD